MSDDLAKKLRETTYMYQVDCELKMKCADRIEELEAKLEKAVGVAERSIQWLRVYGADVHNEGSVAYREAATLAELTGGNDD